MFCCSLYQHLPSSAYWHAAITPVVSVLVQRVLQVICFSTKAPKSVTSCFKKIEYFKCYLYNFVVLFLKWKSNRIEPTRFHLHVTWLVFCASRGGEPLLVLVVVDILKAPQCKWVVIYFILLTAYLCFHQKTVSSIEVCHSAQKALSGWMEMGKRWSKALWVSGRSIGFDPDTGLNLVLYCLGWTSCLLISLNLSFLSCKMK